MKANWKIIKSSGKKELTDDELVSLLIKNRGLTRSEIEDFLNPPNPENISLKDFGIDKKKLDRVLKRIEGAKKHGENVVVYGDYDADGICATAILWETLNLAGINVLPYIPERFSEGYGLKAESIRKLKEADKNLGLIISVDNGIVAHDAVNKAKKLGVDIAITDHHEVGETYPKAYSILHTTKICGAGISWVLAREIRKIFKINKDKPFVGNGLDLAAIGTIADQVPLIKFNRSIAYWGLIALNKTKRPGLISLFQESSIKGGHIGAYEVGFLIAPRLNSAGRLTHAIESLRLLCTGKISYGQKQAFLLGKTNAERQKIVDDSLIQAEKQMKGKKLLPIIILSDKSYHEGVIGLAASKLVERFYRPAIVISVGKEISKASCRSIDGFNIIKNIRKLKILIEDGGGHPMAAGFSIKTKNIKKFKVEMEKLAKRKITPRMLIKGVRIDTNIPLSIINKKLVDSLKKFEPTGIGNPTPTFITQDVEIIEPRAIGRDAKHLKLLAYQDKVGFESIGFGMGQLLPKIDSKGKANIVYSIDENSWNGKTSTQLKLKDISFKYK